MLTRRSWSALALLCTAALAISGCDEPGDEAVGGGEADEGGGHEETAEAAAPSIEEVAEAPRDLKVRRGLGSMTARVPGTTDVISGVRLDAHRVSVTLQDGFARTEVEEEFFNETDRTLEGRYVFPIPPGATVTRLGLWVGASLVEGEIVERRRAAQIFRGIVEDTVRPRDPALLEWVRGGEVSLKIFPIPPHASRKVVLAYDEVIEPRHGKVRYVYPLSAGEDRATKVRDFRASVRVVDPDGSARPFHEVSERDFVPSGDLVVEAPAGRAVADRIVFAGRDAHLDGDRRFFAASIDLPIAAPARRLDRVIILDTSASQTEATIDAQVRATRALVQSLDETERFAVLACASHCAAFPASGLATRADADRLGAFVDGLAPRGASDLAAAIARGSTRLEHGGQIVAFHDGKASAGEIAPRAIADRVLPVLAVQGAELRLIGVGTSVDDVALRGVASASDASYEPLAGEGSLDARARRLVHDLARPALTNARLELPPGFADVVPSSFSSLVPGEPLRVFGTAPADAEGGVARIVGDLGGETVEIAVQVSIDREAAPNPLVPKLWADRAIAELETEGDAASRARVVALSKDFHVLSRQTSLLVLENERMFSEFGIERTTLKAADQADHGFGGLDADERAPASKLASGDGEAMVPRADGGGQGFGSGAGRLAGSHKTSAPMVRMGSTMVSGRLPPEVVQRIVRQNFGRFRACYEAGLRRDPALGGRVTTRFVIGRDGLVASVSDAGSDIGDPQVVSCVVRQFTALQFPQPEGGIVTVTYPIVFASDGTRPSHPVHEWAIPDLKPSPARTPFAWETEAEQRRRELARQRAMQPRFKMVVEHRPGSDDWRAGRQAELAELERAVQAAPESRQKRTRFVRALVANGRWTRAREEAARFVELDPDLPAARELLAQAAGGIGAREDALEALEEIAEAEPRNVDAHLRAARALEAAGEDERACAHRRTLAELEPSAAATALAEACWETVTGGETSAPAVAAARAALPSTPAASFSATVSCDEPTRACPEVAILTPAGKVVSRSVPWQATPIEGGVALAVAGEGTYRTVLLGGDPSARGKVVVRAYGTTREVAFGTDDPRTALLTTITQDWLPFVRW